MKKFGLSLLIVLIIAVTGIILIRSKKENTNITEKTTKIGFMLNGTVDDHSWGQAHYEGMQKTAKELNLDVDYRECTLETEQCNEVIEELVNEGCEVIIGNSYGFGSHMKEKSLEHPEVTFFHCAGSEYGDNFCSYFGRIYQIRYLCGIVAGLQTESNSIGYVAAFNTSEVNRGINAFTLGVRSVNKDANVYVEWTNSWIDDDITENATKTLFENHPDIDIITVHTDSLKAYEIADEKGVWIIGYNEDNEALYPEHFLAAATWNWDIFYSAEILAVLQNKFIGKSYWNGIETGMVKISNLTKNVKPGIKEYVEEENKRLVYGSFDVFYGPIYDNAGKLRVAEGENLSDIVLLTEFDWFVDGVILDNE